MPGPWGVGTQTGTLRGTSASQPQLTPGPESLLNPKTPRPGAGSGPMSCSYSNKKVPTPQGPLLGLLSYLSPANSASSLCNCISHYVLSPLASSRLLSRSAWPLGCSGSSHCCWGPRRGGIGPVSLASLVSLGRWWPQDHCVGRPLPGTNR